MDAGHEEVDKILALMEQDVKDLYGVAADDLEQKIAEYWKNHGLKDKVKLAQLQAGEINQEEYNRWKYGQIMAGKRWEEMRAIIVSDLGNAHRLAEVIINGYLPDVFAVSGNYGMYEVGQLVGKSVGFIPRALTFAGSWTMYDHDTVIRLMRDKPEILPALNPRSKMAQRIAEGKVKQWEKKQVTSELLQGVLQGESNVDIARRMRKITNADWKSAIRYARTATTGAECAGRIESYQRAKKLGIDIEQQWVATLDARTRHSHRQLDGQHIPVGEYFTVEDEAMGVVRIKYPGQFSLPGEQYKVPPNMIWNCRCTIVAMLTGIPELERDNDISNLDLRNTDHMMETTYEEWKAAYPRYSDPILKAKKIGEANKAACIREYREAAKRLGVK